MRPGEKAELELPIEGLHLLASPAFAATISAYAQNYAVRLAEPATRARLAGRFAAYTRSLGRQDDFATFYATLIERAGRFQSQIAAAIPEAGSPYRRVGQTPAWMTDYLAAQPDLARVAYAHVWRSDRDPVLEVLNVGAAPIRVEAALLEGYLGSRSIPIDREVASYYQGGPSWTRLPFAGADLELGDPVQVRFTYQGAPRTIEALWYGPPFDPARDRHAPARLEVEPVAGVRLDPARRLVTIAGDDVRIERSLALPEGFRTRVLAGTRITLAPGVLMTFDGQLDLEGSPAAPVTIAMSPGAPERNRWGGLLVRRSREASSWRHFRIAASGGRQLAQRQDGGGLTGCVTFYEAEVSMQDGRLDDLNCEDALNIVRSPFTLERVTISGAAGDAFDADFSDGAIRASEFLDAGNDGIDVSGSQVQVSDCRFERVGDKAISVGERSEVSARSIRVDGASIGVASKDQSVARVEDSSFRGITDTVYAAYQKKPEFGPATLTASRNRVEAARRLWAMDERSAIELHAPAGPSR